MKMTVIETEVNLLFLNVIGEYKQHFASFSIYENWNTQKMCSENTATAAQRTPIQKGDFSIS